MPQMPKEFSEPTLEDKQERWHQLITWVNNAYESGDQYWIENAENDLLEFGAWVDDNDCWQPPHPDYL